MKRELPLGAFTRRIWTAMAASLAVVSCSEQETDSAPTASPPSSQEETEPAPAKDLPKRGLADALAEMDPSCNKALAEQSITQCRVCHSFDAGQPNLTGPNLFGIYNKDAATMENFAYSPTLREAGIVWDEATLDAFLENPPAYLPNNRMAFGGVRDDEARAALICLLKALK